MIDNHSKDCKWSVCSCGHIAQDHSANGKCDLCSKCAGYDGKEVHHVKLVK